MVTMCIFYLPKTSELYYCIKERQRGRESERRGKANDFYDILFPSFFSLNDPNLWTQLPHVNGHKLDYSVELMNAALIYLTVPWT